MLQDLYGHQVRRRCSQGETWIISPPVHSNKPQNRILGTGEDGPGVSTVPCSGVSETQVHEAFQGRVCFRGGYTERCVALSQLIRIRESTFGHAATTNKRTLAVRTVEANMLSSAQLPRTLPHHFVVRRQVHLLDALDTAADAAQHSCL